MSSPYAQTQPELADVESLPGRVLLQFGTDWCGYCQAAEGPITEALAGFPKVRQIKVEDGPGRPLGRAFRVRLWPTLVFLKDGREVGRLVRPSTVAPVREALVQLVCGNAGA